MAEDKNTSKESSDIFHSIMKASVSKPKSEGKEKTYTEAELLKAIEYACEYQKASDYQTAGRFLIVDESELPANSILLLDELANDNTDFSEIELKDVFK